jgi:hypothetical protein
MRLVGTVLVLLVPSMGAEPVPVRDEPEPEAAAAQIARLTAELKRLGEWEDHYEIIDNAMEGLWSQNQWTSEADIFARETIAEVAKIPPWEFDRRIDKLVERIADRYELSAPQAARVKSMVYRESFGLIWNNAPVLFQQTREYVGQRLRGEPITPEQVAQWVEDSESLMTDWEQRRERLVEGVSGAVDERHRELFEQDVQSLRRREQAVEKLRETWARGEWKPEDWGLQNDPIQQRGAVAAGVSGPGFSPIERAAMQRLGQRPAVYYDWDPSTWEDYVRSFIALYQLDPGQVTAAESILAELLARAADYVRAHHAELVEVPRAQRGTDERYAEVRGLFEELRTRLLRIPREAQIQAVRGKQPATGRTEKGFSVQQRGGLRLG